MAEEDPIDMMTDMKMFHTFIDFSTKQVNVERICSQLRIPYPIVATLPSSTTVPSPLRSSSSTLRSSANQAIHPPSSTPPVPSPSTKPLNGTRVKRITKTFSQTTTELPPPIPKRLSSKTLQAIKVNAGYSVIHIY